MAVKNGNTKAVAQQNTEVNETLLETGILPDVDELIKGAAAESRIPKNEEPRPEQQQKVPDKEHGTPVDSKASNAQLAVSQAAKNLVASTEGANTELLTAGIEQGLGDIKDNFVPGYQIGLLKGIEQTVSGNCSEMKTQLAALRQHLAGNRSEAVDKILSGNKSQESINSEVEGLDDLVKKHMGGGRLSIL